jgi:hypothetical protein
MVLFLERTPTGPIGDWKLKECKELGLEPGNKQPASSINKY